MMRSWLFARVGAKAKEAFPFMGDRCDRVVSAVFRQIASRQIQ
jgi:RNA polymerase sigma-70 factor (ECF subfamily)